MDKKKLKHYLIGEYSLKRFICSIAFVYLSLLLFAYFFADRMIFIKLPSSYTDTDNILKIETKDGKKISAVYLFNPEAEFTILYSHGNAEDIGNIRFSLDRLYRKGFSVFAYDYHGYGTSQGKAGEKTAYMDADAAYNYLVNNRKVSSDKIIVFGRSVGSGTATFLAEQYDVAGLIMESPFLSAFRVSTRIKIAPFDKFDNLKRISKITCPVLIIHGKEDRVVPFWHGKKLYQQANEPKLNLWLDGLGHNDDKMLLKTYWQAVDKFTELVKAD
jgi:fermentation-respiration switch protein FrsA (DUF1100 family)